MPENLRSYLLLQFITILIILLPSSNRAEIVSRYFNDAKSNSIFKTQSINQNNLNKVSLTQKGYIQFLRYIADVPNITEFTFCIWLKSDNLTNNQPLLSYSKNEKERYIRAWIAPQGKEINLAVLEEQVFKIPSYFRENRWYHICQSWESQQGFWGFYLNGKMRASGYEAKTIGLKIPEGGDIVVGQEYTDSNKGLDDGIEGDIFGFNMILSSTATSNEVSSNFVSSSDLSRRRTSYPNQYSNNRNKTPSQYLHNLPLNFPHRVYPANDYYENVDHKEDVPSVLSYFSVGANRTPKGLYYSKEIPSFIKSAIGWTSNTPRSTRIQSIDEFNADSNRRIYNLQQNNKIPSSNNYGRIESKSLGLQLVELSYNCALGKGSPINHPKVIVSWTKTPVRVFGGAILKYISPFCWDKNF